MVVDTTILILLIIVDLILSGQHQGLLVSYINLTEYVIRSDVKYWIGWLGITFHEYDVQYKVVPYGGGSGDHHYMGVGVWCNILLY